MNQNKEKQLSDLPETLQEAITSFETAEVIFQTGKKHKLHVDQIGQLSNEIGLFMMGSTRPSDLTYKISKNLNISTDLSKEIVRELDDKIFKKIKDELQQIRGFSEENGSPTHKDPETLENSTPTQNIFTEKMTGLVQSQTKEHPEESSPLETNSKTPPRHDPYREPTE